MLFNLVDLVRLELRKDVSQMVPSRLVRGLQALEHIRCLRLPLSLRGLQIRGRICHLVAVAFALKLVRLLLRAIHVTRDVREVSLHVGHGCHLAIAVGELAQRALDVDLDLAREQRVRLCQILGRVGQGVPGCGERSVC